jgi:hypothetical protein
VSFPVRLLLCLALVASVPAAAQQAGAGSAYAVAGIAVDVSAPNAQAARSAAFRIAQRKAWAQLWARLTGNPVSAAPRLSDGQLDSIVSGIESQGERFSSTRYIATLGVVFDRSRTGEFLGGTGDTLQSPPMLLLPVFSDGGARTLYQAKTPWRAAWNRYRENVTPIDYVMASGSAGDNIVLTSWQVTRPDRPSWRNVLNRFDAVDVLTAEARIVRSYPGGPVSGLFIARHGPDATVLGRFSLTAADEEGLNAMLDTAVRQIDEIYAQALRDGRLQSEPDLTAELAPIIASAPIIGGGFGGEGEAGAEGIATLDAVMVTPDAATASALEGLLRGTPGVTGVTITSLSLGGTSRLLLNYSGSREMLLYSLDTRGLRLVAENGELVVRRRREGEAPIPRPVTIVPTTEAPIEPALPPPAGLPGLPPPATVPAAPATPAPQPRPENAPKDLLPEPKA